MHSQIRRSPDGTFLGSHGDCRIDVMVSPVQGISEEEHPKTDHRQEMAVDRTPRGSRDDVIGDRKGERRHEEAYSIVNPEAAKRRAPRAWDELWHKIPGRGFWARGRSERAGRGGLRPPDSRLWRALPYAFRP